MFLPSVGIALYLWVGPVVIRLTGSDLNWLDGSTLLGPESHNINNCWRISTVWGPKALRCLRI